MSLVVLIHKYSGGDVPMDHAARVYLTMLAWPQAWEPGNAAAQERCACKHSAESTCMGRRNAGPSRSGCNRPGRGVGTVRSNLVQHKHASSTSCDSAMPPLICAGDSPTFGTGLLIHNSMTKFYSAASCQQAGRPHALHAFLQVQHHQTCEVAQQARAVHSCCFASLFCRTSNGCFPSQLGC